jgi:hyperosmotically inducible protein
MAIGCGSLWRRSMNARIWLTCLAAVAVACGGATSDPGITTAVKSKFAADDAVKAYQIDVDTKEGVVTLSGKVETPAEETQAIALARGTSGVTNVVDHIEVVPDAALGTTGTDLREGTAPRPDLREGADARPSLREGVGSVRSEAGDAGLTASVKAKLLADDQVGGLRINVETEGGNVTLTGSVRSAAEQSRAVQLAKGVEGVKNVTDRLTVQPK